MTPTQYLYLLIIIVSFGYLMGLWMKYLNIRQSKKKVPDLLADVYSEEKAQQANDYAQETNRFSLLSSTLSFVITIAVLSLGWLGMLYEEVLSWINQPILASLVYFGVLFILSDLLSSPLDYYFTFKIEEKYGFNNSTPALYWKDKLKSYLLAIVIGGLLLGSLLYIIETVGADFWIYFWILIFLFSLLMNVFYTEWILPLFNKLSPLEDGELRSAIEDYARKVDFPLTNIFVIDGSKRSNRANAFFTGFGKKKKIVLYDTLLEKHTTEELVAIIAHEAGHYKKRHILYNLGTSFAVTGLSLFIFSLLLFNEQLSIAMGAEGLSIAVNLIAVSILFSPVSGVIGWFSSFLSRKHEYEADAFAAKTYAAAPLAKALKELSGNNLSNINPHPIVVKMSYSHPTLYQRLLALNKL
ncbi:MAG: M48 family metallopeptidase [Cyclobacteriaceae bacterium]|nr:M48 family metallopeptidase [Cyclobacteriaceae bacterium]MCH8516129.1 M48 family metallopeptidase [Cyclobacteriaceae bacterium]